MFFVFPDSQNHNDHKENKHKNNKNKKDYRIAAVNFFDRIRPSYNQIGGVYRDSGIRNDQNNADNYGKEHDGKAYKAYNTNLKRGFFAYCHISYGNHYRYGYTNAEEYHCVA
jgi:hypothetical protein